jgi:peptidoglycan-associated lipoprotein
MKFFTKAIMSTILVAGLAACASDDMSGEDNAGTPPVIGQQNGGTPSVVGGVDPSQIEYFMVSVGDRVFFGTDQYSLDYEAQQALQRQANWLASNPGVTATIEGHADERGTRAYNLALGASRANSVRDYLVSLGISADRLSTVSYGKERPVEVCSNDSCWSVNRRAVTVIVNGPNS